MNEHVEIIGHPQTALSAKAYMARPDIAHVRLAARELYEAAYALECDWDSRRTLARRERYETALANLMHELERFNG